MAYFVAFRTYGGDSPTIRQTEQIGNTPARNPSLFERAQNTCVQAATGVDVVRRIDAVGATGGCDGVAGGVGFNAAGRGRDQADCDSEQLKFDIGRGGHTRMGLPHESEAGVLQNRICNRTTSGLGVTKITPKVSPIPTTGSSVESAS